HDLAVQLAQDRDALDLALFLGHVRSDYSMRKKKPALEAQYAWGPDPVRFAELFMRARRIPSSCEARDDSGTCPRRRRQTAQWQCRSPGLHTPWCRSARESDASRSPASASSAAESLRALRSAHRE